MDASVIAIFLHPLVHFSDSVLPAADIKPEALGGLNFQWSFSEKTLWRLPGVILIKMKGISY